PRGVDVPERMGRLMAARSSSSLWVRCLAIAAVLAAPLVPPMSRKGEGRSVVYVVDRSASIGYEGRAVADTFVRDAFEHRGSTRVGLVAFAAHPELLIPVGEDRPIPVIYEAKDSAGSDVAAAVRLAAAALPGVGQRRIVLLSDGRATRGD